MASFSSVVDTGVSPEQIVKTLELTPHAVERRLSGTKAWTIPELVALAHLLRCPVVDLVDVEFGSKALTPVAARRRSDG